MLTPTWCCSEVGAIWIKSECIAGRIGPGFCIPVNAFSTAASRKGCRVKTHNTLSGFATRYLPPAVCPAHSAVSLPGNSPTAQRVDRYRYRLTPAASVTVRHPDRMLPCTQLINAESDWRCPSVATDKAACLRWQTLLPAHWSHPNRPAYRQIRCHHRRLTHYRRISRLQSFRP